MPDWEAKAIRPRVVISGQEAHISSWGILTPWQLGPMTRMPVWRITWASSSWRRSAVGAGLGKAAGDDDGGLHPLRGALLQGGGDDPGRNHHHRQVRGRRGVGDAFIDLEAQNLVGLGVDGVEGPGEAAVFEVGQDVVAQFAGGSGSADDRNAFRLEDGGQAGKDIHGAS